MGSRVGITLKQAGLLAAVTVMAGLTVFVDEVVHGRWSSDEILADAVVGLLLAATALLAGLTIVRLTVHREHAERGRQLTDVVRAVSEESHAAAVLMSLCGQACEALRADAALALTEDGDRLKVAAQHGLTEAPEPAGRSGSLETVFADARATVVENRAEIEGIFGSSGGAKMARGALAPVSWGGQVRAALAAAVQDPGRQLGARELDLLTSLGEIGSIALEHAEMRAHFERAAHAGVEALAAAVDLRDNYTAEHCEEVVELARRVGERLGMAGPELHDLELAARLHDVGKIGVPDAVLRKPGPLDNEEWELIRQHPAWGAEMLAKVPELAGVAALVRYEHERWDGGGYPDGLRGEEIPLPSRIVFTCDAFHAMTSDRPYRRAMERKAALHELAGRARRLAVRPQHGVGTSGGAAALGGRKSGGGPWPPPLPLPPAPCTGAPPAPARGS